MFIFFRVFTPIVLSNLNSVIIGSNFLKVLSDYILFGVHNYLLFHILIHFLLQWIKEIVFLTKEVVHITSILLMIVTKFLCTTSPLDWILVKLMPNINYAALSLLKDFNHVSGSVYVWLLIMIVQSTNLFVRRIWFPKASIIINLCVAISLYC